MKVNYWLIIPQEANEYYWELKYGDGPASAAAEEKRKKLEAAIQSKNYTLTATYPQCFETIVDEIIKQRGSRHSLILLFTLLPTNEWRGFLDKIKEQEFFRLVFQYTGFQGL